jgi:hypothetical protein
MQHTNLNFGIVSVLNFNVPVYVFPSICKKVMKQKYETLQAMVKSEVHVCKEICSVGCLLICHVSFFLKWTQIRLSIFLTITMSYA